MSYKRKSWQEKLADKVSLPKVLKLEKRFPCYNAVHKMGVEEGDDIVLVNPSEVADMMKRVPKGKLATIVEICKALAQKHDVQGCCSLTTGIFIMTVANAVEEAAEHGRDMKIPYWRTLKAEGFLNEKYPGGIRGHGRLLEKEGFRIRKRGKRATVEDYSRFLAFGVTAHSRLKEKP